MQSPFSQQTLLFEQTLLSGLNCTEVTGTSTQDVLNLVLSGTVRILNLDRYAVSRLVPIAVFRPFRCFPRLNAEREYEKTRVFSQILAA